MKKINTIQQELRSQPSPCTIIPTNEQNQIKGGLLLYCEEKRRTIGGKTYTTQQWKVAFDGSLWLNVKM